MICNFPPLKSSPIFPITHVIVKEIQIISNKNSRRNTKITAQEQCKDGLECNPLGQSHYLHLLLKLHPWFLAPLFSKNIINYDAKIRGKSEITKKDAEKNTSSFIWFYSGSIFWKEIRSPVPSPQLWTTWNGQIESLHQECRTSW